METINSQTIASVRRDGTAFKLDDGTWYSSQKGVKFVGINRGDVVSFTFTRNGDFKNVQGQPTVEGGSGATAASGAAPKQAPSGFPVAKTSAGRAINRQNALGHAIASMSQRFTEAQLHKMTRDEYANDVIETARLFEAYSTGDLEAEAAKALLDEKEAA